MPFETISSDAGVLATLAFICAFFYWLERVTRWRIFNFLPALVFIYAVPALLCNIRVGGQPVLSPTAPAHAAMDSLMLPMMLVLLLLQVDVIGTFRVMGRGVVVMLFGTLGVVLGAPVGFLLVRRWMDADAWKAFGSLAGSWVGGSANLAAVNVMIEGEGAARSLAIIGDTSMYLVWFPVMLGSKMFAERFAKFTRTGAGQLKDLERAELSASASPHTAKFTDYLFLFAVALIVTWVSNSAAAWVKENWRPEQASTVRILTVTTIGIILSMTPLRRIPASRELGMALVMLFMAHMGATADVSGVARQTLPFLLGCLVWLSIHGLFCLLGAWLMHVDIHTAAIASGANIGGVATASQVAYHHKESLVPAGILMALLGYAIGNYAGLLAARLCEWVS